MLNDDEKRRLVETGYLVTPGVVPQTRIEAARRAINASLGSQGLPPDKLKTYGAQSYCPELKTSEAIVGLFRDTPAKAMAESLLGRINAPTSGQIALRFPRADDAPRQVHGHIDGIPTPSNGVPAGTLAHFTMLVGVLLSDLPEPWAGNFSVFPGSHHRFNAWFQKHEPIEMAGGMPPVDPGEPTQITGKAGDVIFAHYLLCHGIATNLSPNIRYAVFFRVNHPNQKGYRPEALKDMWLDWEGLHGWLERAATIA